MTVILSSLFKQYVPGLVLCILIGVVSMIGEGLTGLPVMMLALVLGILCQGLSSAPSLNKGVCWTSRDLLYIGVALLGLRIDAGDLSQPGLPAAGFVLVSLIATLLVGFLIARMMGENRQFGVLMGGAVAICGASAAVAICSALKDCETRDRELAITIAGITGLSALAMILYPFISRSLLLDPIESGLFLGASIHNVSQAVGAGYSVSDNTGDIAVIFKLLRVSALLPIVLIISVFGGRSADMENASFSAKFFALFPPFLIAFAFLAALSCFNLVPGWGTIIGNSAAKWILIISLAAIGMKTNLRDVVMHGGRPLLIMTLSTAFMACFVIGGMYLAPQF